MNSDCKHARFARVIPLIGCKIVGADFRVCADCGAIEDIEGNMIVLPNTARHLVPDAALLVIDFPMPPAPPPPMCDRCREPIVDGRFVARVEVEIVRSCINGESAPRCEPGRKRITCSRCKGLR